MPPDWPRREDGFRTDIHQPDGQLAQLVRSVGSCCSGALCGRLFVRSMDPPRQLNNPFQDREDLSSTSTTLSFRNLIRCFFMSNFVTGWVFKVGLIAEYEHRQIFLFVEQVRQTTRLSALCWLSGCRHLISIKRRTVQDLHIYPVELFHA